MNDVIKTKLENLDKTSIRNEYKLEIYQMYILPSIRFVLTVHDLPVTYLKKLDTSTDQFLKKWAGLPRCATNAILHLCTALNIKKISTLYTETHTVTHCSTRLKGDQLVNLIMDNKIERESKLQRKKSITVTAENIYQSAVSRHMVQGEIPGTTPEIPQLENATADLTLSHTDDATNLTLSGEGQMLKPPTKFIEEVKREVKAMVQVEDTEQMFNHVRNLVKQGKYLELSQLEQTDATWKGYIYNLPRGTMKFLLNSTIDTLPTKVNLKMWGKVSNDKCRCGTRQTLNHILNCCGPSLREGRYTFRHDSVLTYISKCLNKTKYTCYVDIKGFQTPAEGTLPPDVVVTTLKPDIVIIDKISKTVNIFELTVPAEHRIKISHKLKYEKYQHFISDIKSYTVNLVPFEVGSHTGYISSDNRKHIHTLHKFCEKIITLKKFTQNISAIAGIGSYYLFNCRNQDSWENLEPIPAPFLNQ